MKTFCASVVQVVQSILTVFFLFTGSASANVVLDRTVTQLNAEEIPLSYWIEEGEDYSIVDILQHFRDGGFSQAVNRPIVGYSQEPVWFAIETQQLSPEDLNWVLEIRPATLDVVDFYLVDPRGGASLGPLKAGRLLPLSERNMMMPWPVFQFSSYSGPSIIFLRVSSVSLINLLPNIYQASLYTRTQQLDLMTLSVKYGLLLSMIFVGLVSSIFSRNLSEALVTIYCLINGLFWLSQDGLIVYILPDYVAQNLNFVHYGILCFVYVFSNYVFYICLEVRRYSMLPQIALIAVSLFCMILFNLDLVLGQQVFLSAVLNSMLLSIVIFLAIAINNLILRRNISVYILSLSYIAYGSFIVLGLLHHLGYVSLPIAYAQDPSLTQFIIIFGLFASLFARSSEIHDKYITQRVSLESLTRDIKDLEGEVEGRDYFLDMIDHEIRTPVNTIISAVQSLRMIDKSPELNLDRDSRYVKIHKSAQRLVRLSEMVGSSPRRDNLKLSNSKCNVWDEILSIINESSVKSRIITSCTPASMSVEVDIDRGAFQFLFNNILDNAIKYSLNGSAIQVVLEYTCVGGRNISSISVTNVSRYSLDGNLESIFEKYTRFDEAANDAGLGLGLFLVKKIVEAYGGEIFASTDKFNNFKITVNFSQSEL